MWNYDDLNFECKTCGEVKYRVDPEREKYLTDKVGGLARPTCPVCGRVSIPNNGGFSCIHCVAYYELPPDKRPPRIMLMRREPAMASWMAVWLVVLTFELVISGAVVFGGV